MVKEKAHLYDLKPGDVAVVKNYTSASRETARLRDLGLVEGTRFRVIRYAPFGDPVEIKLRGFHLSIGKSTALHIAVDETV